MKIQSPTGPFLVLLATLIFSTLGTGQALAPAEATPYVIGVLRLFGGGLLLLIWCTYRNLLPTRHGWWRIETPISILSLCLFQICFFAGMQQVGVAVGTVSAIGIAPIATGFFCFLFLQERLTIRWFISTFVAILGLLLLTLTEESSVENMQGLMLTTLSGFLYATYIISSKSLLKAHHSETLTMVLSLASGICMLFFISAYPLEWIFTLHGLAISVHFSFITVALGFTLFFKGLQTTPAPIVATLGLTEPLGAALLGIFLLNEPVTLVSGIGMLCMFLAIVGLIWPSKNKKIHIDAQKHTD